MITALETQWQELLNLFHLSDRLTEKVLIERIKILDLPDELCYALIRSIEGNNRAINEYLFNLPSTYQEPVAWMAPVLINDKKRYAWMIGKVSSVLSEVRSRFDKASSKVRYDSLLMCKNEPKPLMFIEPFSVSKFSESESPQLLENSKINIDDFAIFQVGYKEGGDIEDFDQQILLNATLLENNFSAATRRALKVIEGLTEVDTQILKKQAKLLAVLHAEGHNRGHFAGSWPFAQDKTCLLHEAVEEFRACLNAIKWSEYLGLNQYETDLLTFGVFALRFFHFGYRSYINPVKNHQSVREISVGLMFFELLYQDKVFHIDTNRNRFCQFAFTQIRPALLAALEKLNQQECAAKTQSIEGLRQVGRHWYQLAYPSANISPEAQSIYTYLREVT